MQNNAIPDAGSEGMRGKFETSARRRSDRGELGKRTGIARKRILRCLPVPIESGVEEGGA